MPTWHQLPSTDPEKTVPHKKVTPQHFAQQIHLEAPSPYTGTLPLPEAGTYQSELYMVADNKISPTKRAVKFETFSPREHLAPDVFWFQPYSQGIKIESAEFDSLIVPIPNPASTLVNENSQYLIGAVNLNQIRPETTTENTPLRIQVRERSAHELSQILGVSRRDCS